MRNWLCAHGAAGGKGFEMIGYTPMPDMLIGCGIAEWHLGESLSHRLERRFGFAVPRRQSETPIEDIVTAAIPLVGPGKDHAPAQPEAKPVRTCQSIDSA